MEKKQDQTLGDKYGLFGKNIGYSFSRNYFKHKFDKEGIAAGYVNFDVPDIEGLQAVLDDASASGYNVTIPYKEEIIPLLDRLDKHAKNIGAVNTVKREKDGTLTGYNTDFIGFRDSLLERFGSSLFRGFGTDSYVPKGHKALVLGTGGASKAVLYAFEQLGVACQLVSRKRSPKTITYDDLDEYLLQEHTFLVNCTPLGTYPDIEASPDIPYTYLDITHVAYDLIYNPSETTFLRLAAGQDATPINGLRMLELQAEAAWTIWNS